MTVWHSLEWFPYVVSVVNPYVPTAATQRIMYDSLYVSWSLETLVIPP